MERLMICPLWTKLYTNGRGTDLLVAQRYPVCRQFLGLGRDWVVAQRIATELTESTLFGTVLIRLLPQVIAKLAARE